MHRSLHACALLLTALSPLACGGDGDASTTEPDASAGSGGEPGGSGGGDASGGHAGGAGGTATGGGTSAGDSGGAPVVPSLDPGSTTVTLPHGGQDRSYIVYVPATVASEPVPLVLNYHGLTSNAIQQQAYSQMDPLAESEGFVVAYPEGLLNSHNAGSCCGQVVGNTADDGDFARAVIADVSSKVPIDPKRVYSTGMSNGGYMSEYNACVNADLFAAVAPVSAMASLQPVCEPSRPVPMLAFNGTEDDLVNYEGSRGSIAAWVERNGCQGDPARGDFGASYCETWSDCTDGATLTACTITGMQHCWPGIPLALPSFCENGGLDDIAATPMIWDFFKQHTLP